MKKKVSIKCYAHSDSIFFQKTVGKNRQNRDGKGTNHTAGVGNRPVR